LVGLESIDTELQGQEASGCGTARRGDVAILSEDVAAAHVRLAIAGARSDLWYPISTVTVE
jgi:hypothetical protein